MKSSSRYPQAKLWSGTSAPEYSPGTVVGGLSGGLSRSSEEQVIILLEEEEECNEYFADCAFHDEDDSTADLAQWYREDTFNRLAELCAAEIAQEEQEAKGAESEEAELLRMRACDVNALSQP